jgi:sulfate adenylyltransferase subunit 2
MEKKRIGEHFRVFPLSNWTEMDIWQYIYHEKIEMPSLYFTHEREVIIRDNNILANTPVIQHKPTDIIKTMRVRFRTIGDMTCTGAVESPANSIEDIIDEVASSRVTERGGRADDKRSESAMEDRKKVGYIFKLTFGN